MKKVTLTLVLLGILAVFSCKKDDKKSLQLDPSMAKGNWRWIYTSLANGRNFYTVTPASEGYTELISYDSIGNWLLVRNNLRLDSGRFELWKETDRENPTGTLSIHYFKGTNSRDSIAYCTLSDSLLNFNLTFQANSATTAEATYYKE